VATAYVALTLCHAFVCKLVSSFTMHISSSFHLRMLQSDWFCISSFIRRSINFYA